MDDEAKPSGRKRHGARNQNKMIHLARWLSDTFPHALDQASLDRDRHVLDVAGGKGELAARLCMCLRKQVVLVDPREADLPRCFMERVLPYIPKKWQQKLHNQILENESFVNDTIKQRFKQIVTYFDENSATENAELLDAVEKASMIVGMHADGATEAIVDVALEKNIPFVVIPCCVFPNLFQHRTIMVEGKVVPVRSYEQFCIYLKGKDPDIQQTTLPFNGRNEAIYFTGRDYKKHDKVDI